ncbi:MAG: T9SS type A sorting domain-containing protein [Chitinophagaceae bacterium]
MKKTTLLVVFGLFFQYLCAQNASVTIPYSIDTDTTLTNVAYLKQIDSINYQIINNPDDSAEGGPKQNYFRYRSFIESRLPTKNFGGNMLAYYAQAFENARIANKNGSCSESYDGFTGNFTCIGPKDKAELHQNQGMVTDIWVDPTDDQFIYIATEGGGLWKSTNGGTDWTNISDNIDGIGTIGINKMAVNPFDRNEVYISTSIYPHFYNPNSYGIGVWRTTNGGATWSRETNGLTGFASIPVDIPQPEYIKANGLQFSPYKVNNQSFLIMTINGSVLSKLGSNPWTLYTPNWGGIHYQTWPFSHGFGDIEFAPDMQGVFFISNQWDNNPFNNIEVYQIKFDLTDGSLILNSTSNPNPKLLMDATSIKAMNNNTGWSGPVNASLLNIQIEYLTNGNFGIMYNLISGNQRYNRIFFWDMNNSTVQNIVLSNIPSLFAYNQILFEIDPINNDAMYVGLTQAVFVYKNISNLWSYKYLSDYSESGNYLPIHADIRKVFIGKSTPTANIPSPNIGKHGFWDKVYWGTDGGLSSTSYHDYTQTGIGNISSIDNLNGNNLYIGDMYDVDFDLQNEILTSAQYHGGYKISNKITQQVNGEINGDGFNARYDTRFLGSKNILVRGNESLDLVDFNKTTSAITLDPSGIFTQPENPLDPNKGYRFSPMQFREEFMDLGITNAWESLSSISSNGYGNGNTEWKNYFDAPNTFASTFNTTKNISTTCVQFKVAQSDPNIAYNLFAGNAGTFLFTRGEYNTPNNLGHWDWRLDRTPPIVSNTTNSFPANDFEMDPKNANRLFMAIAGVNMGNAGVDRVITSVDGGITWDNMSNGLTELPVNCLVYQNGSDDIIYAGTDDGVYFWHKPTQCWIKMSGGMPNCLITRLRIDYCRGKLMVATYGRGIWESDLINLKPGNVSLPGVSNTITSNTTWNKNKIIQGSILIKSGATLTIQGTANPNDYTSTTTIHMPKYGTINIEKGAKLMVDGAKLTNECGAMWYGIRAYGDGASPQTLANNYYTNQGFVELKNNAILENVEEAFTNAGGNDWPLNTGGVIYANKAIIRNARRCAQFLKYQNIQTGGALSPDKSKFLDCTFIVDKTIHHNSPLITMWAVRGVEFEGCRFLNTSNLDQSPPKMALVPTDASYWIHNSANQNTLFEGLQIGLQSASYSWDNKWQYPIIVEGALFDKNETGIDYRDLLYPYIKDNIFNTGMIQHPYNPAGDFYPTWGSRLTNVGDYVYCSNKHYWPYATPPNVTTWNCGVDITNGGPDDVVVEKNFFDGMQVGTCVAEINGSQSAKTGINFRWNRNINNQEYDFVFGGNAIIRPVQTANLATNVATGNTFSGGVADWWHWPGGNSPADYYYNSSIAIETPVNILGVNPISTNNILSEPLDCARYSTVERANQGILTEAEFDGLITDYDNAEANYNAIMALYYQLIDGGSTAATEQEIETATVEEVMQLRTEMLSNSPYLSLEVLQKLAEENILPQSILLEIILANPEGSQSDEFLKYLQYDKPNPMPSYMISMIKTSWTGATVRSITERTLMQYQEIMETKKSEIIMAQRIQGGFLSDEELVAWMQKIPTLKSQYELIEYYLSIQNYASANAILTNLPNTFSMTDKDIEEYAAYTDFYNFKKNLLENSIEINALDSNQIQSLKGIADAPQNTFARSMARNTLCFFYNICYPMPLHDFESGTAQKLESQKINIETTEIRVYPNPAKEYVVFEYNLENNNEVISLLITDIAGKLINKSNLSGSSGQFIFDSSRLKAGAFAYQIVTKDGTNRAGTFIIK